MIDNFRPYVNYKPKDFSNYIKWDMGTDSEENPIMPDDMGEFIKAKVPSTNYNNVNLISLQKSQKKVGYRLPTGYAGEDGHYGLWISIVPRDDGIQDVWWWTDHSRAWGEEHGYNTYPFDSSDSGYVQNLKTSHLEGIPFYYLDLQDWDVLTDIPFKDCMIDSHYGDGDLLTTINLSGAYLHDVDLVAGVGSLLGGIDTPTELYIKNLHVQHARQLDRLLDDSYGIRGDWDMSGIAIRESGYPIPNGHSIFEDCRDYNSEPTPLNISNWDICGYDSERYHGCRGAGHIDLGLDNDFNFYDIDFSGWKVCGYSTDLDINIEEEIGVHPDELPGGSGWDIYEMYHLRLDYNAGDLQDDQILDMSDWTFNSSGYYTIKNPTRASIAYIDIYAGDSASADGVTFSSDLSGWQFLGDSEIRGDHKSQYMDGMLDGVKNIDIHCSGYSENLDSLDISNWYADDYTYVYNTKLDAGDIDISHFSPSQFCFDYSGYGEDGDGNETFDDSGYPQRSAVFRIESASSCDVSNWNLSRTNSLEGCFLVKGNTNNITGLDTWDVSDIINFDRFLNKYHWEYYYDEETDPPTLEDKEMICDDPCNGGSSSESTDFSDLTAWRDDINQYASCYHILPQAWGAGSILDNIIYPEWNGWFDVESTFYPYQSTIEGVDEIYYKGNIREQFPLNTDDAATKAEHPERYPVEIGHCYGNERYVENEGYFIEPVVYTEDGWVDVENPWLRQRGYLFNLAYSGSGITPNTTEETILADVTGSYHDNLTGDEDYIDTGYCSIYSPTTPYPSGSQRFYVNYTPDGERYSYLGYFIATVSDPSTAGWITASIPDDLVIYPDTTGYEIIDQILYDDPMVVSYHNPVTGYSGYAEAEDLSITDPIPPYQVGQTEFTMLYEYYDEGYDVTYHSTYTFTRPVIPAPALQLPMTANYGSPVFDFDYASEYDTEAVCREPLNYSNVLTRYNADFSTSLSELPSFCNHFMNPVSYGTPVADFGADRYDIPIFTSLQYNNYNLDFTDYNFVVFNVGIYASGARRNMAVVYVPKNKFVRYINGELYSTKSFTAYMISEYGLNEGSSITNWQFSPHITEYTATLQNGYYKVTISSAFNTAMFSSIPVYWSSDLNATGTDVASIMADTVGYASVPMTGSAGYNYFINCNGVFHEPSIPLAYNWNFLNSDIDTINNLAAPYDRTAGSQTTLTQDGLKVEGGAGYVPTYVGLQFTDAPFTLIGRDHAIIELDLGDIYAHRDISGEPTIFTYLGGCSCWWSVAFMLNRDNQTCSIDVFGGNESGVDMVVNNLNISSFINKTIKIEFYRDVNDYIRLKLYSGSNLLLETPALDENDDPFFPQYDQPTYCPFVVLGDIGSYNSGSYIYLKALRIYLENTST